MAAFSKSDLRKIGAHEISTDDLLGRAEFAVESIVIRKA
jgi:hypothetical protein